jgi:hypothetical protein
MGQCVSRKAGAVVAASGHHNSPSYRIMDKAQKQVSFTVYYLLRDYVESLLKSKSKVDYIADGRWTSRSAFIDVERVPGFCRYCIYAISTRGIAYIYIVCTYACTYVWMCTMPTIVCIPQMYAYSGKSGWSCGRLGWRPRRGSTPFLKRDSTRNGIALRPANRSFARIHVRVAKLVLRSFYKKKRKKEKKTDTVDDAWRNTLRLMTFRCNTKVEGWTHDATRWIMIKPNAQWKAQE